MHCKANKYLSDYYIVCIAFYFFALAIYIVAYIITKNERTFGGDLALIGAFLFELFLIICMFIISSPCIFVINASSEGIMVTRRAKILLKYKWSEIKDFGSARGAYDSNIIYFSTYVLTPEIRDNLYLRMFIFFKF